MLLSGFEATRPRYELSQARSLDWLVAAHAEAEAARAGLNHAEKAAFATRIARVLQRCACTPEHIARRGHSVRDVELGGWDGNEIYDLRRDAHGAGTAARSRLYSEVVDAYFVETYAAVTPPDDLVHVTCTGYSSPSGAQQLVARRGWPTRVTHAYHMGCYAALPAVRIAQGLAATGSRRVDIVHTELCSLHLDPSDHRVEQLVVQSLFADGLIRYSLAPDGGHGLRVIALHEQLVPDSAGAMRWIAGDHGMQMTLARDVPERIAGVLRAFVIELYERARIPLSRLKDSVFAVHPGGPRIIDGVQRTLELSDAQVAESRAVLRDHGNMSSATLPHVWQRLDRQLAPGTLVASLAFGPGLTVCGGLFEKR
ncbi:MAG: naringenin-chalcone synthase [Deltaproteobacteria bacterium]|nr:naringenin-chalcone synthase [Deltaproteobacteria bacterium]